MSALLLRLAGPMQSWGTQSRFTDRDTGHEPSKSGVVGLLCAALGRGRDDGVEDVATMTMGVRVDVEGKVERDFQTALEVRKADGRSTGTVVSSRAYLADASFLVALQSDDTELVGRLAEALVSPVWPPALGRKSYVPALPVLEGTSREPIPDIMRRHPWHCWSHRQAVQARRAAESGEPWQLRVVRDDESGTSLDTRLDHPVCFSPENRTYRSRPVVTEFVPLDVGLIPEAG